MADLTTFNELSKTSDFNDPTIDLLVVYNGDQFYKPWSQSGREKHGSLTGWNWVESGENEATYRATKPGDGDDFYVRVTKGKAIRIYPR